MTSDISPSSASKGRAGSRVIASSVVESSSFGARALVHQSGKLKNSMGLYSGMVLVVLLSCRTLAIRRVAPLFVESPEFAARLQAYAASEKPYRRRMLSLVQLPFSAGSDNLIPITSERPVSANVWLHPCVLEFEDKEVSSEFLFEQDGPASQSAAGFIFPPVRKPAADDTYFGAC